MQEEEEELTRRNLRVKNKALEKKQQEKFHLELLKTKEEEEEDFGDKMRKLFKADPSFVLARVTSSSSLF